MKTGAIAVFAKTPDLSPVKTRLAANIGESKAQQIYSLCVDSVQDVLIAFKTQNPAWNIYWVLGEEEGPTHPFWQNRPFEKKWTGDGDLGTRLYNVHHTLMTDHDSVMVMSTDSPQLSTRDLEKATQILKDNHAVVGPAHDGGYYLFGSDFEIGKDIWETIPYSQKNTREEFLKKLDKKIPALDVKSDLDVIEDVQKILSEMQEDKTSAQTELAVCLESLTA